MFPESPQLHHPHTFQLSPSDFRPRASSNASSISRLSPIPAVESELQDGPWSPDYPSGGLYLGGLSSQAAHLDRFNPDQLVDNIAESMKIRENGFLAPSGAPADLPHMTAANGYGLCHPANPLGYAPAYAPPNPPDQYRTLPPQSLQRNAGQLPRSPQRLLTAPADLVPPPPPPYSIANLQVSSSPTFDTNSQRRNKLTIGMGFFSPLALSTLACSKSKVSERRPLKWTMSLFQRLRQYPNKYSKDLENFEKFSQGIIFFQYGVELPLHLD